MFTQVYYHKTRRAYDYMLGEALKGSFDHYPPPDKINEFLQYDDYKAWQLISDKQTAWFSQIVTRNHIKVVKETSEEPTEQEKEKVKSYKEKLGNSGIWFWEDRSEDAKFGYDIENEEIQIIDKDGNVRPLSQYSKIVLSLKKKFGKIRIYVKSDEREKVKKLMNDKEVL